MTSLSASAKPDLKIVLCSPRGFCAGVVRAIDTVERALAIYGAPVYVRHEIVHNRYVVDSLKTKGAIFVEELAEIPDNVKQGLTLTTIGIVVGLAGALALNRLIASLLFGVQPTDVTTIVAVVGTITLVAAVACWLPAWRASRVDPNIVLRDD